MKIREFKPTTWAVENRVSVFVMTVIITLAGIITYNALPKAQFPDIVIPTVYINAVYQGTSPTDIENLITRPIEKELKSISGVKKINSSSLQDVSIITVEFTTDVEPAIAKQRVQDAVDKSRSELPSDLDQEPIVQEVDFSEFPIMTINVSGNYDPNALKKFAEDIQDPIEALTEITRVDIIGAPEREVQINADVYKMQAASVAFQDIRDAVNFENVNLSGGDVKMNELNRTLRVIGEFTDPAQIEDIVVKSERGNTVYLRDIAEVVYTNEEAISYARMDRQPVISLSVIKKSGENLIAAAEKIDVIMADLQASRLPGDLIISVTNDQSVRTRKNLEELLNSVLIGFILVVVVLMFFMGIRNAIFVGLAVPLSSALSFLLMPVLDFSFNIVVTFSFLLALGIIVDNAIVVIENTYRLYSKERMEIKSAAKLAAGEVFTPVLAGTLTTLAPFFPLLFWPGIIGEFMVYMPIVLIITLSASLFVAFVINPVFAVSFMRKPEDTRRRWDVFVPVSVVALSVALLFRLADSPGISNLIIFAVIVGFLNKIFITPILIANFQSKVIPWLLNVYRRCLSVVVRGINPYLTLLATVLLLVATFFIFAIFPPPVVLFPESDPNQIFVYIQMPDGTRAAVTDSVTREIEDRVFEIVGEDNPLVKSIISNVGINAGEPNNPDRNETPHKGRITVDFVEFEYRKGVSTQSYLDEIRAQISDVPGAKVTVDKEQNGPPTGKPIQVEIKGDDFAELIRLESEIKSFIVDSMRIAGIEELKSDLVVNKPEIIVDIKREKALEEGLSSFKIGNALRTALYGDEISQYRDGEDEYPIQLRLSEKYRHDLNALLNLKISYQDGPDFRQVPISSVADIYFSNTFGGINRKNLKRIVILSSNVLTGYNPFEINQKIIESLQDFPLPAGYEIALGGEQEDQQETSEFLGVAFLFSILLVFFVMVTQFNSSIKPFIIMSTVLFSTIGVLLGFVINNLTISTVMTGVGIVSLAGIVVNNGILLIDFTDLLRRTGSRTRRAIIEGGAIRFTPVLLTAITTMLGLVPLVVGLNINFGSLFAELDPKVYLGGDNVAFWKPMASAIIFGLGFSTLLTLFVVPSMYFIQYTIRLRFKRFVHRRRVRARARYS